jgi:hypothetical protein
VDKEAVKGCLRREVALWSAKSFDTLAAELNDIVAYERSEPSLHQVEVELLEMEPGYVQVMVGIDAGGFTSFAPLSTSFLVHRDGRVEIPDLA